MTERDIYIEFERQLHLLYPQLTISNKLSSDTILSTINKAIEKFVVTRYTGMNFKQQSFEQTQKRTDDLRTLVVVKDLTDTLVKTGFTTQVNLPSDYMLLLGDTAYLLPDSKDAERCWVKDNEGNYALHRTDTIESTVETLDRMLNNSLSEHNLRYSKARPIRLVKGNQIILYTDGNYIVANYELTYLKKPKRLTLNTLKDEYTDLPEHTIREIVEMAVGLFMSTQNDQRYNSINSEIATME